jgi:hypothetical protein
MQASVAGVALTVRSGSCTASPVVSCTQYLYDVAAGGDEGGNRSDLLPCLRPCKNRVDSNYSSLKQFIFPLINVSTRLPKQMCFPPGHIVPKQIRVSSGQHLVH